MQREIRHSDTVRPVVYALLVFITLGVNIANEMLAYFGLDGNYVWLFSVAFLVAALLLGKNLLMVALVVIGVAVINMPDTTLAHYGMDRDLLLSMVCAIILVPTVYALIND